MSSALIASRAASLMNAGPTVPYCGPIAMPTRFGVLARRPRAADGLDVRRRRTARPSRTRAARRVGRSGCRPCAGCRGSSARTSASPVACSAPASVVPHRVRSTAASERQRTVRREALDGERAGDAHLPLVLVGLVVEQLVVGVPLDRRVDLLAAHAFLDVRVVGDRLQGDVLDSLVDEPVPDVVGRSRWR